MSKNWITHISIGIVFILSLVKIVIELFGNKNLAVIFFFGIGLILSVIYFLLEIFVKDKLGEKEK